MRIPIAIAAAMLLAGPALAGEADKAPADEKPIVLKDKQLDRVTAGDLLLPNDKLQFEGINNPGKDAENFVCTDLGMCHPTFNRSLTAIEILFLAQRLGLEGPWAAGRVDNVIDCIDCP